MASDRNPIQASPRRWPKAGTPGGRPARKSLSENVRNVRLTAQQDEALTAYSIESGIPVAELIRHAVDLYQTVHKDFH